MKPRSSRLRPPSARNDSGIPCPLMWERPRALPTAEVGQLVGAFVQEARRAQAAGADAIELHGAHGYLIGAFLFPLSNQRTARRRNRGRGSSHSVPCSGTQAARGVRECVADYTSD
jgi:2,4-dienoyl-CoA reductase-like NADH-dependent reductase (Old Yellow Enzyme family)